MNGGAPPPHLSFPPFSGLHPTPHPLETFYYFFVSRFFPPFLRSHTRSAGYYSLCSIGSDGLPKGFKPWIWVNRLELGIPAKRIQALMFGAFISFDVPTFSVIFMAFKCVTKCISTFNKRHSESK